MNRKFPELHLWRAMREQRWELTGAALLGFIASACAVALLGTAGWLIATAAGAPPVLTLTVAAVMVRAFALGRAVFRYVERLAGHDAAFRGLVGLRVVVYEQFERLAPAGISNFGRGDLLTRLVADVDTAVDLPLRLVLPWAQSLLVLIGTSVFFWWLLPGLAALMAVFGVVALALIPLVVSRNTSRSEAKVAPKRAELASALVVCFSAVADINAFGADARALSRIDEIDRELTALGRTTAAGLALGGALMTALQGAAVIGVMWLVIPQITDGALDPVWIAVAALIPLAVFDVLATLPNSAASLHRVRASAERIESLSQLPSPVVEPLHPCDIPAGFRSLVVRELSSTWPGSSQPALYKVSFELQSGQHMYIAGPSGSGKSTLANVFMGFANYSGSALINGVELAKADHDELRLRVGWLAQRAHIFDTTIDENIVLGREEITANQVADAVTGVQLDEMVNRLPRGRNSNVGAFGAAVSGGEGQRIALARLTVDPRPLVILDEPTEHLDGATARAVERILTQQLAQAASITITHHLLMIPDEAMVLELHDGCVVNQGTCQELRSTAGWFQEQWLAQYEVSQMEQS